MSEVPAHHRTAAAYQAALSELRERHLDEFEEIYQSELDQRGIALRATLAPKGKERILAYIGECQRRDRGPQIASIAQHCGLPMSSTLKWLRELCVEGAVIAPGSGRRHGYRLPA
jgi:hypothetical protein